MPDTHEGHEGNGWRGAIDVRVAHLECRLDKIDMQVAKIQETVWRAAGAVSVIIVVADLVLKTVK